MEEKNNEVKEIILTDSVKKENIIDKEKEFLEVLKIFAPGTSIRSALDDLLNARMGALIVFENDATKSIIEKGFRVNAKFSQQRLVELAKMDGAIIISRDGKKILSANTLLYPNVQISTKETGTRHKAAERTSKQTSAVVIAVSERKNKITIYYGDLRYELRESSELLRRAAETLQVLEKQREIYNDLMINLNLLEISNLVTINDICDVLQRLEIIKRISGIVKRHLIELGKEGMVVSMRLRELTGNLNRDTEIVFKDYFDAKYKDASNMLEKMNFDFLLEPSNLSRMLFEELHDKFISPKGLRLLSKLNLLDRYVVGLISKFRTFDKILSASDEELLEVFDKKENVDFFKKEMNNLKEKIIIGKDINNFI